MSLTFEKLQATLRKQFSQAILDHQMIEPGDLIMVGLSGGKDSWALLALLADLQKRAPVRYSLCAVTIDGGLVGLDPSELEKGCQRFGVPFTLIRQSIFETVADKKDKGSTFCSMCAKLRRGALYTAAHKLGATKIALGHHLDDAIETLFLNLFYGGRLAALPPVLLSNAGHMPILRPLLYCEEASLSEYVSQLQLTPVGCACPVCPTHPEHEFSDLKRHKIRGWLRTMEAEIPQWKASARHALQNMELERFSDPQFTQKGIVNFFTSAENMVR